MSVPAQRPATAHVGNAVTTVFPYNFLLFAADDLVVTGNGAILTLGVDYTVSGLGSETGGNVTFVAAPASGAQITLYRQVVIKRDTDYQYQGDFQSPTVNRDFDRLVQMIQDARLSVDGAIRLPPGDLSDVLLPAAATRALKSISFDEFGNLQLVNSTGDAIYLATVLASSIGAAMVGWRMQASGLLSRTVQAKLSDDAVSVLDALGSNPAPANWFTTFQVAIAAAKVLGKKAVYAPARIGGYPVTGTFELTDGTPYGVSIIGDGPEATNFISGNTGTTPLFQFTGGSGTPGNIKTGGFTVSAAVDYEGGTAFRLDGVNNDVFENIVVRKMNRGLWLHNDSPGAFTEFNVFRDVWFDRCDEAIAFEQGGGNDSFHGNCFDNVTITLLSARSQIGINHASGYYYGAKFDFHIFTDGPNCRLLIHSGNAEKNYGSIHYECQGGSVGYIEGTGRWSYFGSFDGLNRPRVDSNYNANGEPRFVCTSFIPEQELTTYATFLPADTNIKAYRAYEGAADGLFGQLVKIEGATDQNSIGVLTYTANTANNGFYVMGLGYHQAPEFARPLWALQSGAAVGFSANTSTATGAVYAGLESRSLRGGSALSFANSDGYFQFQRSNFGFAGDAFTHDVRAVVAVSPNVRDDPPVPIAAFDARGLYPYADNAVSCGATGVRWSSVWSATGAIQTSDARQKKDIAPSPLGLDFINALNPVAYRWKVGGRKHTVVEDGTEEYDQVEPTGEKDPAGVPIMAPVTRSRPKFRDVFTDVPGSRLHYGFLAQEVHELTEAAGVDFAGWVKTDPNDPDSEEGLRYEQFIAPLVLAVQQLTARVAELESQRDNGEEATV